MEQVGRRDPNRLKKAAVPSTVAIGSRDTIRRQQQSLLIRAMPVDQIQMQRGNRGSNPNVRFHPIPGRRLKMAAGARNGCPAGSQELSGVVGFDAPYTNFGLGNRPILEPEVLLKVAVEGQRTQRVSRA